MEYKFTADWFLNNVSSWEFYLEEFKNKPNLNFLEIGVYEGRSTIWLLENILTDKNSKITCIDLFNGELEDNDMTLDPNLNLKYEEYFLHNVSSFKEKVTIHKGRSSEVLRNYPEKPIFDFAYIDGSHTAYGTLTDAILIHPLIKPGGMIIFDDYGWKDPADLSPQNSPELAIKVFCHVFEKQYELIHHGWQVIIKKII
jgi:predicted O-methyltransferase YrrM